MKRYYAILVCIILASNIGIACAQEVECQNVKYEILDGHQVRVMRVTPYRKMLQTYSGIVYIPDSILVDNNVYYVTDVTDAFRGCKYIKEVRLPSRLTYIICSAFSSCSSLQHIELPDEISRIYSMSFYKCSSLQFVKLPAGLQRIGDSAFDGCTHLRNIEIPQHVATIEEGAFAGCKRLKRVVLPQSVDTIGCFAFGECKGIKEIYVYAVKPPVLVGDISSLPVFDGVKKSIPVHIPKGSKPLYTQAPEWSLFTNYIDDL